MARTSFRPVPDRQLALTCLTTSCPECGQPLWAAYTNRRTVVTADGAVRLTVQVRRCRQTDCPRLGRPLRPEAEGTSLASISSPWWAPSAILSIAASPKSIRS